MFRFYFMVMLLSITTLASEINVGISDTSSNGKDTKAYSLSADFNNSIEKFSNDLGFERFYTKTNNNVGLDTFKFKNVLTYSISENTKLYFKVKYLYDGIGTITNQTTELVGISYIKEDDKNEFGLKVGMGNIHQLSEDRLVGNAGLFYKRVLTENLKFKLDEDYIKYNGGVSTDLKTSLVYEINKLIKISLSHYDRYASMELSRSSFSKTELALGVEF